MFRLTSFTVLALFYFCFFGILLETCAAGRIHEYKEVSKSWLGRWFDKRQTGGSPADSDSLCRTLCTPSNCGGACSNSKKRKAKRDVLQISQEVSYVNVTSVDQSLSVHSLSKRIFTTPPNGEWSPGTLEAYLANLVHNGQAVDPQFAGIPIDPAFQDLNGGPTTSVFHELGTEKLQIGNGGLYGCTQIAVMSKRAVWMVHIFEVPVFSPTNTQGITPDTQDYTDANGNDILQVQAIDILANTASGRPAVTPVGPKLDASFFNQPGDQARAVIMSPLRGGRRDNLFIYNRKLGRMEAALRSAIPGIRIDRVGYSPLEPTDPQLDTSASGVMLYQYDADRQNPEYRLFVEDVEETFVGRALV